jgi:CDP-diacylglycerol--glycerol-3-phosphate 3-phosphatidyltransferase
VKQRVAGSASFGPSALMTPANAVTVGRLLASPVLLAAIVAAPSSWATFAFWAVLALTDGADGWMARRHGTTTSGAFLDPLADKCVVLVAMLALVVKGRFWWFPVAVIAGREAVISAYRFAAARRGVSVPARSGAKLKTVVQDVAVGLALLPHIGAQHPWAPNTILWAAVALTLVTGAQYLLDGRRVARAV